MRRLLTLWLLMLATGLAGCGGKHMSSVSSGRIATAGQLPDGSGGHHKTGKPYEVAGHWYYPMATASGYDETGVASWYGRDFHGKRTANGERYDMHALSAAHKTLPLPTLVRVTNLDNGRSVIVRVNDRGPFVKSRLIDLSYAAAKALGYADRGTAHVRVQTLDVTTPATPLVASRTPLPAHRQTRPPAQLATHKVPSIVGTAYADESPQQRKGGIYIQLGAFSSRASAEHIRSGLLDRYPNTFIQPVPVASQTLFRVRIGPLENMHRIEQTMLTLQSSGYADAIVVIE